MGFMAVRWENENSVSVVKEKKVVGAVELKEGTTVDILTIDILSKSKYNGLN